MCIVGKCNSFINKADQINEMSYSRASCPVCRNKMSGGVSLLASTVLESIDHKCPHEGCTAPWLPLQEMIHHKVECQFRPILCPAPPRLCGKRVSSCLLLDHILTECNGSGLFKPNGTKITQAEMISEDYSVMNKLSISQLYRNPRTKIPTNKFNLNCPDVFVPGMQLNFAFQWNNRYYYLKNEPDLGNVVKLSVIVLDDVTPRTDSKGDVTFVLHMNEDKEFRNGKIEFSCPVLTMDEHEKNSEGFVIPKSFVRKFARPYYIRCYSCSEAQPHPSRLQVLRVAVDVVIVPF